MSDDIPDSTNRSLLDRIAHAIGGEPKDLEDIKTILKDAQASDIIDLDSLQMVLGVFKVVDERVRDIMIPRAQMVVVEHDMALDELISVIVESGHSRFPVIGEDKDDIMGVLLAKDVLRFSSQPDTGAFDLEKLMRTAVTTPESKRLNILLKEFRSNRNHMAIVFDEYGGVAGLVTIEDVLEEIVGEIDDEHDIDDDLNIREHGDGRYSVRALTPIEEFNEVLKSEFSDDEFDTIGGLLMKQIGHMPKPGESAELGDFQFKVLAADSRRIHLVQVARKN